jgi:CBS domain-containing protein
MLRTTNINARSVVLCARTAVDLMTANPTSICADATIREAATVLTDRGISAAPVIDEAGLPCGVLSRTDVVKHDSRLVDYRQPAAPTAEDWLKNNEGAVAVEEADFTRVRDIMTPAVFTVSHTAAAAHVVAEMTARNVHRLFVVDGAGVLVGVISAIDVVRRLAPQEEA